MDPILRFFIEAVVICSCIGAFLMLALFLFVCAIFEISPIDAIRPKGE